MAEHDMRKNLLDAGSKLKTDAAQAKSEQSRTTKQMQDALSNYEKDLKRDAKVQQVKNGQKKNLENSGAKA